MNWSHKKNTKEILTSLQISLRPRPTTVERTTARPKREEHLLPRSYKKAGLPPIKLKSSRIQQSLISLTGVLQLHDTAMPPELDLQFSRIQQQKIDVTKSRGREWILQKIVGPDSNIWESNGTLVIGTWSRLIPRKLKTFMTSPIDLPPREAPEMNACSLDRTTLGNVHDRLATSNDSQIQMDRLKKKFKKKSATLTMYLKWSAPL